MSTIAATASPARTASRRRLTIKQGNALQLAGLLAGAGLLVAAAQTHAASPLRFALLLVGFASIYLNCHAIGHYLAGRLVGLRFRGYGVHGTDHPEVYPPGIRQLMEHMPFYVTLSTKESRERAGRIAKAVYHAAGETSTAFCTLVAAYYAAATQIPGGGLLFISMIGFNAVSTVITARTPKGDYAKALRALRGQL